MFPTMGQENENFLNMDLQIPSKKTRKETNLKLLKSGVVLIDPDTTFISPDTKISKGSKIYPYTFILGKSEIGGNSKIGPNSLITDSKIGSETEIIYSVIEESEVSSGVSVGPFSHLRPKTFVESKVRIGNFAEIKNSKIGEGSEIGNHCYIGDANLGRRVNVGAGTITANFDGVKKHQTEIADKVFLGSNTVLVAPVKIGEEAKTGAGAVVINDLPPNSLSVGVPAKVIKIKGKRVKTSENIDL